MWKRVSMVLLAMVSSTTFAQVQLTVPELNASPGTQIVVPILISEGQDITAIQFNVTFDETVLTPAGSFFLRGESLTDHTVGWNQNGGQMSVVIFSGSLGSLQSGSGAVIKLVLEVDETAVLGERSDLTLSEIQASDTAGASVAVTGQAGGILFSDVGNVPVDGQNQLVFPQFANGEFQTGTFGVTLIFVNRTGAAASGKVDFVKSNGEPFSVTLTDGRSGNSFDFDVPDGGSTFLQTDGLGTLSAGYAKVSATAPLGGTLLFAIRDLANQMLAEAGVGSSPAGTDFSIPVLYEPPVSDTGIAFANLSAESVDIDLILRDASGLELDSRTITLESGEHTPQFATQYFPSLSGSAFQGSIEVHASSEVSAIALKQQGLLLTTFPVIRLE
jgi:hypothetical protein